MAFDDDVPCPCGLGDTYGRCCGRLHRGAASAATAELLMRSRFSAFTVGNAAYLLQTWHNSTRPAQLTLDPTRRWLRLEIVGGTGGGLFDATGTVEFRAYYVGGVQQENSSFVRDAGRWLYVAAMPGS